MTKLFQSTYQTIEFPDSRQDLSRYERDVTYVFSKKDWETLVEELPDEWQGETICGFLCIHFGDEEELYAKARMRVATNRRVQRAGRWEDDTEWHTVVAFGKSADFAGKYLKKGRQVYVEGRLQTNRWVDKHQIERQATSVVVETIRGLGKREDDQGAARPAATSSGGYEDAPF